jgi:hypothetical protein
MKRSVERVLATIGAATVLVVGANAISYAATGSSFLLGGTNIAKKVTTIKNAGSGAVLNLQAKSPASAPFTTNGKGLVGNLNSQFLSGKSLAQVQAGATKLNGLSAADIVAAANQPLVTFNRTDAATTSYNVSGGATFPAVASKAGAAAGTYDFTGTINYACGPAGTASYTLYLLSWDGTNQPNIVSQNTSLAATDCGKTIAIPPGSIAMTSGTQLMVMVYGSSTIDPGPSYSPATVSFSISGQPARSDL